MIQSANNCPEGWKVVKYLEKGSGKFIEDDEEMTEKLEEACKKVQKDEKQKKPFAGRGGGFKGRNNFFKKSSGSNRMINQLMAAAGNSGSLIPHGGDEEEMDTEVDWLPYGGGFSDGAGDRGFGGIGGARGCFVCGAKDYKQRFCPKKKSG